MRRVLFALPSVGLMGPPTSMKEKVTEGTRVRTRGEAVEGAEKEAESDALKRAARNFGSAPGIAL